MPAWGVGWLRRTACPWCSFLCKPPGLWGKGAGLTLGFLTCPQPAQSSACGPATEDPAPARAGAAGINPLLPSTAQPTATFPWQEPTESPFPAGSEPSSIPSCLCGCSPLDGGTQGHREAGSTGAGVNMVQEPELVMVLWAMSHSGPLPATSATAPLLVSAHCLPLHPCLLQVSAV